MNSCCNRIFEKNYNTNLERIEVRYSGQTRYPSLSRKITNIENTCKDYENLSVQREKIVFDREKRRNFIARENQVIQRERIVMSDVLKMY